MSKIKISGLITTYNEERLIESCINYHAPFLDEIVILDGNSTDKTLDIIERLSQDYPPFFFIVSTSDEPSAAKRRNKMQEIASHDWVLHVDVDELFDKIFLGTMKNFVRKNPDIYIYRLCRFNLPFGNNWPDRQLRLVNRKYVHWIRDIHEIPAEIGKGLPFDMTNEKAAKDIKDVCILHRVTDRDEAHRVETLRRWRTQISHSEDFSDKDKVYEIRHIDKEIQRARLIL